MVLDGANRTYVVGIEDAEPASPTTSHTSTLMNVAGASGISRRELKLVSADRAFSSVSNSQKECWIRSPSSKVRAQ